MAESGRIPGLGGRIKKAVAKWEAEHGMRGLLAFSKTAGVSDTALGAYISAEQEPGAVALARIAKTARVSVDYLLFGEEERRTPSPREHVRGLLATLRTLPQTQELANREYQRRYRDFVTYVGMQLRRLVFDVEMLLAELYARQRGEEFEADEHRRRLLDREDEP